MINDEVFGIIKSVLDGINVFFVIYMIGYSTFLFLAVVTGSSELFNKRQQEKLKKFVKKRLSAKEVVLSMTESPQLIGGFVIEAGGHRFDRSVKSKLNALNRKLVRR